MDARTYQTKNLEIGSTIKTITGLDPDISFDGQGMATLQYPMTQAVSDVVMRFESGIQVDARTVLTVRNQIYKRVRGGGRL